jgi:hypothetical protein
MIIWDRYADLVYGIAVGNKDWPAGSISWIIAVADVF